MRGGVIGGEGGGVIGGEGDPQTRKSYVARGRPKQGEIWRSTHKAVHTQGSLWPPQES